MRKDVPSVGFDPDQGHRSIRSTQWAKPTCTVCVRLFASCYWNVLSINGSIHSRPIFRIIWLLSLTAIALVWVICNLLSFALCRHSLYITIPWYSYKLIKKHWSRFFINLNILQNLLLSAAKWKLRKPVTHYIIWNNRFRSRLAQPNPHAVSYTAQCALHHHCWNPGFALLCLCAEETSCRQPRSCRKCKTCR